MRNPDPSSLEVAGADRPPGRHRLVLAAIFVDAVGSGIWLPFDLIFFTQGRGQSMQIVGLAITLGALLGLLVGQLSGALIDRYGPGGALVISNVTRAVSFALYPLVSTPWQVVAVVFLTAASDRVFWTANTPFMGTLVRGRELDKLLGTCSILRVVGLGIGSAAAGLFASSSTGLNVIALINATSFAIAAVFLASVVRGRAGARPPTAAAARPDDAAPSSPIRDTAYLQLCLTQGVFVLLNASFVVVLPLVIVKVMHGPAWLPGTALVVGNVVLATLQRPVLAFATRRPRSSMLLGALPFYVAALLLLALGGELMGLALILVVLLASILSAVGEVISGPLMAAAAYDASPANAKGRYSATFQTTWGLAEAVAPATFTMLVGWGNATLWLTLTALALALVPLIRTVRTRLPPRVLMLAGES